MNVDNSSGSDADTDTDTDADTDTDSDVDEGSDAGDECSEGCPENYWNIDGESSTGVCGCEYFCEWSSDSDPIDPEFTDENCDGTDGVVDDCVFVASSSATINVTFNTITTGDGADGRQGGSGQAGQTGGSGAQGNDGDSNGGDGKYGGDGSDGGHGHIDYRIFTLKKLSKPPFF